MAKHNAHRCSICQVRHSARASTAEDLAGHFHRHGFIPTALAGTPGEWMWKWLRSDPKIWFACTSARGHVEKRMRQIEQLALVDAFVADDEARFWLDISSRAWEEGLPRIVASRFRETWDMGDEMPGRNDLIAAAKRMDTASVEDRIGVASALHDRLCNAAPVGHDRMAQLICIAWGWLPEPGVSGFLLGGDERFDHLNALWQGSAYRLLQARILSFTPEARRPLLGWIAATLLPFRNSSSEAMSTEAHALLSEAVGWPADPRLDWLASQWSRFPGGVSTRIGQVVLDRQTQAPVLGLKEAPRRI